MRNIDIGRCMQRQEERLINACETLKLETSKAKWGRHRFRTKEMLWQAMIGDTSAGEPFSATYAEVKLMSAKQEKTFTKALDKWKPGKDRPRLTTYTLVKDIPKKDEKKLWEP